MADAALKGQGAERADPAGPSAVAPAIIPQDTGGVVVDFNGPMPEAPPQQAFGSNLALPEFGLFTDQYLQQLGHELVALVDEDDRSRDEWKKTYARGLTLLGLKYEERTDPWEGACGAFHPMLLESVIRFNAQAMMDIFPGAGPVKTQIIGDIDDLVEQQALRVQRDLNYLTTRKIKGYRLETDMMLFNLPLAGTTFRKFGFDEKRQVPWAEYVLPEHVVMPYSAASLDTTPRYSVILPKTKNWVESRMANGRFRTEKLTEQPTKSTEITEAKDKIEGRSNTNQAPDNPYRLYEVHIEYYFEADATNTTGLPVPYIVTVAAYSNKVLSITRNWKEGDPAFERQMDVVQHKYMPGFGPYGIGLINILGGLTESSTSILRQLVDAGTLSNLPAGYKTKSARIKDDSSPIGPGEWRDVEISMGNLKESFMPLPYGEPSQVLAALLGQIVDEGRRIGSVADMKITDMTGQNMPVGTTLAIIERSMKVMSAVQQRLYESFTQELIVISEIVRDFMGQVPYPFRLKQREMGASRQQDYDDKVDVIPVADPNASTMAQRIMVMQAIIQLTQTAPNIYNLKNVHRDMITVLGSDKADFYIPPEEEVMPADPVSENMALLTGKPVRAGIMQDHAAHITVHVSAAEDPKIVQMLMNNPAAGSIQAAATAHILEHLAFQYRADIEEMLGVQLPPPGEPLPEDVEYQIAKLSAAAAEKLLQRNKAEAAARQALENLQDPVVQNETESLRIKAQDADTKRQKVMAEINSANADRVKDLLITIFKEQSATERAVATAEVNAKTTADGQQLAQAELASRVGMHSMDTILDLLHARLQADDAKASREAAAQRPVQ
ncbi:MAG: hypothetical protein QG616_688 [Pseudomonadota bacterium]|jgi:hypothetical protein|nr:hypothetical protein [Pseudomonadota bacterium]